MTTREAAVYYATILKNNEIIIIPTDHGPVILVISDISSLLLQDDHIIVNMKCGTAFVANYDEEN